MSTSHSDRNRFVEKLPLGMVIVDSTGTLVTNNETGLRLLNVQVEDLLLAPLHETLKPAELALALGEVLSGETTRKDVHFSRGDQWIRCSIIRDGEGNPESGETTLVVEDVTSVHKIEELKREFIQDLLHGFKGPLSTLKVALTMLTSDQLGTLPESVVEILDMSRQETDRLNALLGNIRNLFNIESGLAQKDMEPEVFPLDEALLRAIEEVDKAPTIPHRASKRVCLEGNSRVLVHADFEMLKQSLQAVFANAMVFAPDGGPVRLVITDSESQVTVQVTDTGIGIADSSLPRIFTKHFREDNDITRTTPGQGLGLFAARSFLELMGGAIYAESKVGSGTTMTIIVPKGDRCNE